MAALATADAQQLSQPGANFATALPLTAGEYVFRLDEGDIHYFRVDLRKGETLLVALRMPTTQDFDIFLLDPFRQIIDQGIRPAGLTERLGYLAVEDGPHYIVVLGFAGSSGIYTLSISVMKPATVTETVTATVTSKIVEVETSISFATKTVTEERVLTHTVTDVREVEKAPWALVGFAVLGLAVIAAGISLSNSIERFRGAGVGKGESQPSSTTTPQPSQE